MTVAGTLGAIFFIIAGLLVVYSFLIRRDRKKKKRLLADYDETEDLSKQGEENRQRLLEGGDREDSRREPSFKDIDRLGKREVLPLPPVDSPGQDSIGRRESRRRPRGILRKLGRRNS